MSEEAKNQEKPEQGHEEPEDVKAEETVSAAEATPAGTEDAASATEAEAVDPVKQLAEMEDKYLRCRAEFDNYRKRMTREFGDIRDVTRRTTITDFLTVYDYFAMAMASIETAPNVEIMKQGMEMIWQEFQKVLDGLNVKVVESLGKPFDAKLHEAVSQEASDTVAEGVVLREWKKAFMIGDKLLRPAVVVVSSGPAKPSEASSSSASEEQPSSSEESAK